MGLSGHATHGLLLASAAVLAAALSVLGLITMLSSDFAKSADHSAWPVRSGYSSAHLVGMIAWIVLTPVVVACFVLSSRKLQTSDLPR
jgi:DMSO/TMAO reductase YedYZ heme-binding membrane subunit